MTIADVAGMLGVSHNTARDYLRSLGRTTANGGCKNGNSKERPGRRIYNWDVVAWKEKFDSEIARELNCAPAVVTQTRRRQKRPKGPDGRKVSPWRGNRLLRNVQRQERATRILATLRDNGSLTRIELSELLSMPMTTLSNDLPRLVARGRITHERGAGAKGQAFIYSIPDSKEA